MWLIHRLEGGENIVRFPGGKGIFLFSKTPKPPLRPILPSIQWPPWDFSPQMKQPKGERGHSPPSTPEVNKASRYTFFASYGFRTWASIKHRGIFGVFTVQVFCNYYYWKSGNLFEFNKKFHSDRTSYRVQYLPTLISDHKSITSVRALKYMPVRIVRTQNYWHIWHNCSYMKNTLNIKLSRRIQKASLTILIQVSYCVQVLTFCVLN
jgi:hypothetical protein